MNHRNHKRHSGANGQTMPEYGTIIAFMAITLWVLFQFFGTTIRDFFISFGGQINGIAGG